MSHWEVWHRIRLDARNLRFIFLSRHTRRYPAKIALRNAGLEAQLLREAFGSNVTAELRRVWPGTGEYLIAGKE